jgi:hypothetical protein
MPLAPQATPKLFYRDTLRGQIAGVAPPSALEIAAVKQPRVHVLLNTGWGTAASDSRASTGRVRVWRES